MFCHNCGRPAEAQARFCTGCGANLSMGIPHPHPSTPVLSEPQPTPPPPATYMPVQQPVVYLYRDAPVSVKGSYKVPLIIMMILALVGLMLYLAIPIGADRVIQSDLPFIENDMAVSGFPGSEADDSTDSRPDFSEFLGIC